MTQQDSSSGARAVEMYCPVCDASYTGDDALHCPNDGAKLVKLVEKQDALIGRRLDERFTIKSKLGAGGMGAVYRALQHSVGRTVAIKVIEPRLAGHREVTKRFLREAQLSSRLSQPNTVSVLDFGQTNDGLLYLVMELLEGNSLEEILEQEGALSEDRVIRIGIQICDALDAASVLHIVHRDLKPGNVVILDDPPGRDMVKVLDFGIAKSLAGDSGITTVTRSDMILGTPSYMAPEAVSGSNVDGRADLYSLGVMLYQLVSGRLPFKATTVNAMLASHSAEVPIPLPPTVQPKLRTIIEKLLAKAPEDRYSSAAEARAALTAASRMGTTGTGDATASTLPAGEGSDVLRASDVLAAASSPAVAAPTRPDSVGPELDASRRSRAPLLIGAFVAVAAAGAAVLFIAGGEGDPPAAPASEVAPSNAEATSASPALAPPPAPVATTTKAASPEETVPRQPAMVSFTLDSNPQGMRVVLRRPGAYDEELCPRTPCENITRPKLKTKAALYFHGMGFRPYRVEIDLNSDEIRRSAEMVPTKTGTARRFRLKPQRATTSPAKTTPPQPAQHKRKPPPDEGFLPAKRQPGEAF